MLRVRTLVRQLSRSRDYPQLRSCLHSFHAAPRPAASPSLTAAIKRAAQPATAELAAANPDSLLKDLKTHEGTEHRRKAKSTGVSGDLWDQPASSRSPKQAAGKTASSGTQRKNPLSEKTAALPEGSSSLEAKAWQFTAKRGHYGPVIEDDQHPLRAKAIPLMTLEIMSKLRRAGIPPSRCSPSRMCLVDQKVLCSGLAKLLSVNLHCH